MKENQVSTKTLLKSGFWYTAASFLTRAMAFLTMPVFTRLLTHDQYGGFSSFATYLATMIIICGLEVYSTLNRARFDFTGEGELDGYITSSLVLSTLFTGFLFVLYLIFPDFFSTLIGLEHRYMIILFSYLLTYPAFAMFHAKQRIEYRYKLSSIIAFSVLIAAYALSFVLTMKMEDDRLMGRIFGQYFPYVLTGIGFYVYFITRSRHVTVRAWKYALRIGLPLVFAYLGSQLLLSSDVLVVKRICSNEEVSYLSVSHSCSHIILLLVQSMNTAWAPWFFDMLKIGNTMQIRRAYRAYLWVAVLGTFGVVLFGPELILLLGGEGYLESIYILPIYILCGVFTVLTAQFSNLETYYKKTEYAAIFTGIAAVLNIGLDIIGVKIWGYRTVAYATLICQMLLVALHYIFTKRMGVRDFLPLKSLISCVLASLLIIPTAFLLYQSSTVRYIVICLLAITTCAALIVKREEVKTIIQRFKKAK